MYDINGDIGVLDDPVKRRRLFEMTGAPRQGELSGAWNSVDKILAILTDMDRWRTAGNDGDVSPVLIFLVSHAMAGMCERMIDILSDPAASAQFIDGTEAEMMSEEGAWSPSRYDEDDEEEDPARDCALWSEEDLSPEVDALLSAHTTGPLPDDAWGLLEARDLDWAHADRPTVMELELLLRAVLKYALQWFGYAGVPQVWTVDIHGEPALAWRIDLG